MSLHNCNAFTASQADTFLLPRLQAAQRKDVRLYYGTRSEAMTPFQQEAAEWEGVQLCNVYSSAGNGYVQVGCFTVLLSGLRVLGWLAGWPT